MVEQNNGPTDIRTIRPLSSNIKCFWCFHNFDNIVNSTGLKENPRKRTNNDEDNIGNLIKYTSRGDLSAIKRLQFSGINFFN